jgi:hypothetical protein
MAILTAQAFKDEVSKVLDDIFKHEYRRPKELNAEIHCAENKGRNEEVAAKNLVHHT